MSSRIFQCEFGKQNCLGGDLSACATGYTGILCASCTDDFYRLPGGCKACPGASFIQFWISFGAVCVFCVFLILRNNGSVRAPVRERHAAFPCASAVILPKADAFPCGAADDQARDAVRSHRL